MSAFDLREFNTLSKRHNYFMTNNRIEGFPPLAENSLILRKILEYRSSNSSDKRFENKIKPKKIVRFKKPENIPYSKIYQSPILIKKKQNNSNGANRSRKLVTNLNKNDNLRSIAFNTYNQIIMSPRKDLDNEVNKNLVKPTYYKIRIFSKKANNSPEANNQRSPTVNNINSFDNENDSYFLNLNGRKIFTNSFCGINSDTQSISPEKNLDNNTNKIGTELFRNYNELNKKKFEIYKRKIKKNTITTREEFYEKQKEKGIKRKNLNMQFQEHLNDVSNDENKMRIIPITKKRINNINNIKRINNRFRSNKRNYNSNNNINHNHKNLSFIINDNNNSMNKTLYNNNSNNYNKINNISFSKEGNPNSNSPISNNILYSKKAFKSNNIYISKYSSPRKIDENNFIENSDTIRQKYIQIESPDNDYNNKTHSLDRHNNPYNFIVPKKRFVEDYTFRKGSSNSPVFLSSNDHKVCIKMHILHGINELFYGKVKTKEKLKMQRVISICFLKEKENENKENIENENKENIENENENKKENKNVMVGANFMKNKNPKNKFDLKSLSSIKEEEEKSKSKLEHDTTLLKNEINQEIKEENVEENNKKNDEKINFNPNPKLDKNKVEENQSKNQNDNQKVRIKLLKEKPEIELIKLEPKVETKDNKNNDNNIKRRRFLRSYPNLMPDLVNEQTKVEIKEENNFRNNIRRKYERSKDKSETKKDEPKIEIKDNKISDKNIRRRFQRSNPKPEVEVSKNEAKDDKKENQNQNQTGEIKSFRRRFQK